MNETLKVKVNLVLFKLQLNIFVTNLCLSDCQLG